MSGFAGSVGTAAGPDPDGRAHILREKLRSRGPGDLSSWQEDGAVLAHSRLGGTPDGRSFGGDGPLAIAGDIRLDNRAALGRALGAGPEASEGALVGRAWSRWRHDCCAHLAGDFAFAVWDRRAKSLFLARDRFGVRPLFFARSAGGLSFGSAPELIAARGPRPPDEEEIAAFLAGLPSDPGATPFDGVERLPPAHWLWWRDGQVRTGRYWTLAPDAAPPADPETAFRDRFAAATGARLASSARPAALLSGGLDSSSICAVAGKLSDAPLRTYSIVHGHDPALDESRYIDAVLARGAFRPVKMSLPAHAPLAGVMEAMRLQGGPYPAPGLLKSMTLYRRIASDGVDVILNGHGGDEVVWHGTGRLPELARAGRWPEALALVPAYCRLTGADPVEVALTLAAAYGRGAPVRRGARAARSGLARLRGGAEAAAPWQHFLAPDLARRARIAERIEAESAGPDDAARHLRALASPAVAQGFEVLDKATAAAGLEARYPFYDQRLVTLCLALPSSEKFRRDGSRSILRRALAGTLPDAVARRQDKTDFASELSRGLAARHRDVLEAICAASAPLAPFVRTEPLREAVAALLRDPAGFPGAQAMFLWRAACLHLWLRGEDTEELAA